MDKFNFGELGRELQQVQTEEEGVTFEDKQLTWDTAEHVKDVVDALNNAKVVRYLKLEGNTLGVDAAAAIGKALERHPEFCRALWRNLFTRRLKNEIPEALNHLGNGLMVANAHLVELDLSDNALGPNGMVGLEALLRSPVCYTLKELRLNNCGLGIGGGQMLSKALLDCHKSSTKAGTPLNLKVFIAGRNRLENDGAKAIAKMFQTLQTLEEIGMPQNSIYHVGIAALADGFAKNPNLRILNLNDNTITHKGATALADAFTYTPKLCDINFGDCLLKTNGAYQFAEKFADSHFELEIFDLASNEIGSDAGLAIVQMALNKPKLRILNLDGNQFGEEGCTNIINEMEKAINPKALLEMEDDQSEGEDDEEYVNSESEELDEDDNYDNQNDTTEEADEDDEEYQEEDEADESAYTTTQPYNANTSKQIFSANDSLYSQKSFMSAVENLPKTAASFCLSRIPWSLQMFESLKEDNKLEAFRNIINQFSDDNHFLVLIFTTLKCAHLSKVSNEALDLAIALYTQCIEYANKTEQERRILNYMLIQLGLLRSEYKFNSPYDLKSCRFALRKTLDKQQIASDHMKNAFNVFLDQLDV